MKVIAILLGLGVCVVSGFDLGGLNLGGFFGSGNSGSSIASPTDFPFESMIVTQKVSGDYYYCAGALITTQRILTAAQCCLNVTQMKMHLGVTDFTTNQQANIQTLYPSSTVVHEKYDPVTRANDICIINFKSSPVLNRFVNVIGLPAQDVNPDKYNMKQVNVSGWGLLNTTDAQHMKLQYAPVSINVHNLCYLGNGLMSWAKNFNPPSTQICSGNIPYDATCKISQGDTLTTADSTGKRILIGLASLQLGTCDFTAPGTVLYTYVPAFIDWINKAST